MKIGLAVYPMIHQDTHANLEALLRALHQAQGQCDFLMFPEAYLQGFESLSWDYEKDQHVAIENDSAIMNRIRQATIDTGVGVLFGYFEKENDTIYSSSLLIMHGQDIHKYRRITKNWKEYTLTDHHYQEGTDTSPFYIDGKKLNIALCGDMWICPERFETDGILLWPIYVNFTSEEWVMERNEYATQSLQAASEALLVNGLSKNPDAIGGAFHYRDGNIVEEFPFAQEGILIVNL